MTWKQATVERVRSGDSAVLARLTHGTITAYTQGCPCDLCRKAMADYQKARRHRKGLSVAYNLPADERRRVRALERERAGLLDEITQVKNGVDGKCCPVDGVPLPARRGRTCSSRCTVLWRDLRSHLDDEEHKKHRTRVARWRLHNSDDPAARRAASRILAGEPTASRGSWVISHRRKEWLDEVMERRNQAVVRWGELVGDLAPIRALEREDHRRGS